MFLDFLIEFLISLAFALNILFFCRFYFTFFLNKCSFFYLLFFKELVKQFFLFDHFLLKKDRSNGVSLFLNPQNKRKHTENESLLFSLILYIIVVKHSSLWLCEYAFAFVLIFAIDNNHRYWISPLFCLALLVSIYIFYSQTLLCTHKIRYSFSSVCLFCSIFLISHILSGSIFDICYTAQLFSSLFWFFHPFIFCDFLFGLMTVIRKPSRSDRISNFNKSIQSIWSEHKTSWARWSEFHN